MPLVSVFPFTECESRYARVLLFTHAKTYDHVFYHPVEFPLIHDGVRNSDHAFQSQIDKAVKALWAEAGVPLIEITGTIAERVQKISDYIFKP